MAFLIDIVRKTVTILGPVTSLSEHTNSVDGMFV
jgi:hypothetical protein